MIAGHICPYVAHSLTVVGYALDRQRLAAKPRRQAIALNVPRRDSFDRKNHPATPSTTTNNNPNQLTISQHARHSKALQAPARCLQCATNSTTDQSNAKHIQTQPHQAQKNSRLPRAHGR